MAVVGEVKGIKLSITYDRGSQSIGGIHPDADEAGLYAVGVAVAGLHQQEVSRISKIVETNLINQ